MEPTAFDENDVLSAAVCAWKEARGEVQNYGIVSIEAVLFVLRNRVGFPGFAKTIHDVVYGKNQFTSMSVPSDPEFNLQPAKDDPIFTAAVTSAAKIFNVPDDPSLVDPTHGAHYYANLHN